MGTPLLFKPGDRATITIPGGHTITLPNDAVGMMQGIRFEKKGLMPRGWAPERIPGTWKILGTIVESLGKDVSEV